MEFYAPQGVRRCGGSSFNSQRDGILLKTSRAKFRQAGVSIPNGMEFYPRRKNLQIYNPGFNSQRDGILHLRKWKELRKGIVSIPNGMEFYIADTHIILELLLFQFPTGWNSTNLWVFCFMLGLDSFNSQRDGILLKGFLLLGVLSDVSIPNGMEFYQWWNW